MYEFCEVIINMANTKKHLYTPTPDSDYLKKTESTQEIDTSPKELCPCCGHLTVPKGTDENFYGLGFICPVCYWEIDTFISNDKEKSDSNHGLTLTEARLNYKMFGAVQERLFKYCRKPTKNECPLK